MSDEEKITTDETQEQIKPVVETPEDFKKVAEMKEAEVASDVGGIKEAGERGLDKIEERGRV